MSETFDLRVRQDKEGVLTLRPRRTSPAFQPLLDRWYAHRGESRLPLKSAFPPALLAPVAPFLLMWEVEWSGDGTLVDAHIRLVGTLLESMIGLRAGMSMNELTKRIGKHDVDYRQAIFKYRQPVEAVFQHLPLEGYEYIGNTRLALPLSRDGERMDFVIVVHKFHTPDDMPDLRP